MKKEENILVHNIENTVTDNSRVKINVRRIYGESSFAEVYLEYLKSKYGPDLGKLDSLPECQVKTV